MFSDYRWSLSDESRVVPALGDTPAREAAMGHADIQTTGRYLHARQASEQVERFARARER